MRFLYGIIAIVLWAFFISFCVTKGMKISDNIQFLSLAIVVAGAISGGD